MRELSFSQQQFLIGAFKGYPVTLRAQMHKHAQDILRPMPVVGSDDVRRAAEAALLRYAEGKAA